MRPQRTRTLAPIPYTNKALAPIFRSFCLIFVAWARQVRCTSRFQGVKRCCRHEPSTFDWFDERRRNIGTLCGREIRHREFGHQGNFPAEVCGRFTHAKWGSGYWAGLNAWFQEIAASWCSRSGLTEDRLPDLDRTRPFTTFHAPWPDRVLGGATAAKIVIHRDAPKCGVCTRLQSNLGRNPFQTS